MVTTRSLNSTLDRMITLNRALDHAFNAGSHAWVPAIDITETKDAYVLYADLPGVDASGVEIAFEKNVLTLKGAKPTTTKEDAEVRVHAAERLAGKFERSVRLPEYVDGEKITAAFANGLLTVTVPKAKAAQARRIEIKN